MSNSTAFVRGLSVSAVVIGAIAVGIVLFGGGNNYELKANFQNASQLVKGDQVQVSGNSIGSITGITLTPDGQAQIKMKLDRGKIQGGALREGTQIIVRAASLSGIANRYLDVRPSTNPNAPKIPNHGTIDASRTTTAVDLDEIFNIFGPKERKALSGVIRGSATEYAGKGPQFNEGLRYLNPAIASSSRLFRELNRDTPLFERFILANSKLVSDLAERQNDLSGLVDNLATTTGALGRQRAALAEAIRRLPEFMRRSNTTFVNLRRALDDLTPLVNESKPVAKKLRPFLAELRPFARDARPTIRDLATLIRRPGSTGTYQAQAARRHRRTSTGPVPEKDLIELANSSVPLRDIAVGPVQRNGKERKGALPETTKALAQSIPELASARPYAVDLIGWFSDFSHPGIYDALGGMSRAAPYVNAFAAANGVVAGVLNLPGAGTNGLVQIPPSLRQQALEVSAALGQNDRCPGSMERDPGDGSGLPFKPPGVSCNPSQTPVGP